jgi:arylsulfatase A-like enzyme
VYATASYLYIHSEWSDPKRWERRLTQNPHAVLLASCLVELGKAEPFTQPFHFDEIDESDFRRPGERSERPDPASGVAERPRNVLLIILESTAAEYLSVYGAPYPTTPHLERLAAANGIVYENMYAQAPASWKSLVGLMASTYCRPDWRSIVGDCPDFEVPLLPEVLARHGWRNCFLHAGYWDWRGGEEFLKHRGVQTLVDARHLPSPPLNSWGTSDRAMFRAALDWIDANQGHPFFVCACTIETHHPYWPGDNPIDFGVGDEEFNRYLNALRTTDENIHWMVEELARRGLRDSTLVAVTADHGESFGQHDERVHGYGVYEPSVHVPLVLIHPGLAGLARRDRAVRQQIDVPPTLLGLLGVPLPAEWQGRDLLAPAGPPRKAYFYSVADQVVLGLRDGSFKYHFHVDTGLEELFDLSSDPGERMNLAARRPELLRQYKRCVGGFVKFQREFLEQHGGRRMVATAANGRR